MYAQRWWFVVGCLVPPPRPSDVFDSVYRAQLRVHVKRRPAFLVFAHAMYARDGDAAALVSLPRDLLSVPGRQNTHFVSTDKHVTGTLALINHEGVRLAEL